MVASPGPATLAEAKRTPPGVRRGSLAAAEAKARQLEAYAQKMEKKAEAPYDPCRGILSGASSSVSSHVCSEDAGGDGGGTEDDESALPAHGKKVRLFELSGSWTLRDMQAEKAKRRMQVVATSEQAQQRKAARIERAADAAQQDLSRRSSFAVCSDGCECQLVPCPWEGFMLCACGNLKRGLCKKRECVVRRRSASSGRPEARGV